MKPAAFLVVVFLALVAVGHFLRVLYGIDLIVGDVAVPMSLSLGATVVTGALAVWLVFEQRKQG